jgi:hypothetical protein
MFALRNICPALVTAEGILVGTEVKLFAPLNAPNKLAKPILPNVTTPVNLGLLALVPPYEVVIPEIVTVLIPGVAYVYVLRPPLVYEFEFPSPQSTVQFTMPVPRFTPTMLFPVPRAVSNVKIIGLAGGAGEVAPAAANSRSSVVIVMPLHPDRLQIPCR